MTDDFRGSRCGEQWEIMWRRLQPVELLTARSKCFRPPRLRRCVQFARALRARGKPVSTSARKLCRLLLFPGLYGRLRSLCVGVFLLKSLHSARCIEQFLFAREKRMATRADFHAQHVAFDRRARLKRASAGAVYEHFVIIGMNSGFHEGTFLADRSAYRHTQPDVARSTETFRLRESPQRCKASHPPFAAS